MKFVNKHFDPWKQYFGDVPKLAERKKHILIEEHIQGIPWVPAQTFAIAGLPVRSQLANLMDLTITNPAYSVPVIVGVGIANPLDPFDRKAGIRHSRADAVETQMKIKSMSVTDRNVWVNFGLGVYNITIKYAGGQSFPIIHDAPVFSFVEAFYDRLGNK